MLAVGVFAGGQTRPSAQETINKLNADLAKQKKQNEELQAQIDKLRAQLGDSGVPESTSQPATATRPPAVASRPATATSPATTKIASSTDADIEKALLATVKELTSDGMGLEKVLGFLRESQKLNMFIDWNSLQQQGVDRNTPVTVNLKNVTFEKALVSVLTQAASNGGQSMLDYSVSGGVLNISSREAISSQTTVKTYDVRRLLANKPNVQAAAEELQELIKRTARPESWRDNGGTAGAISYNNGALVITQSYQGHKAVAALLATLR